MKPLKKHYDFVYAVYFPIVFIALIIVVFFPQIVVLCFSVHVFILLMLLILACLPFAKIKLGSEYKSMAFVKWLAFVILITLSLNFVYLGLISAVTNLPVTYPFTHASLINTTKNFIFNWWGFPWMIFFAVAIHLTYVSFFQNKTGQLSLTLQPIIKNKENDNASIAIDFLARTVAHFSLAITIGIITLHTIGLLSQHFQINIFTQFRFATLAIATIFLVLMNLQQWQTSVRFLVVKKIPVFIIAAVFIIVIALCFIILNLIFEFFAENISKWNQLLLPFAFHWQRTWLIFSAMWWLSFLPLISGFIAAISRGFTIRKMILGGMIVLFINNAFLFSLPWLQQQKFLWQFLSAFLPYLGFFIIALLFMRKKYLTYAIRSIVPFSKEEKPRSVIFYTQTLLQVALFMIIFYFPMGIYLVNIFVFVVVFPLVIVSLIGVLGLVFRMFHPQPPS